MLISKSVYYGIKGIAYLAREKHFCSIQEIVKKEKIPATFLEKIFQKLKKAGLVSSKKGIGGGFALAVSAGEISFKKIISALNKKTIIVPCLVENKKSHCPINKKCKTKKAWQKFYRNFEKVLENLTLVDFLE